LKQSWLTSNWKIPGDRTTTPLPANEPKTLDTLPYELLRDIAGRLGHKDIKHLVLTSRKFESVVQTFLYQNLSSKEIAAVVCSGNVTVFCSVLRYPLNTYDISMGYK
jgi:hypothetical protein